MDKSITTVSSTEGNRNFGALVKAADLNGEIAIENTKTGKEYRLMTKEARDEISYLTLIGCYGDAVVRVRIGNDVTEVFSANPTLGDEGYYRLYRIPTKKTSFAYKKGELTISYDFLGPRGDIRAKYTGGSMFAGEDLDELKKEFEETEGEEAAQEQIDIISAARTISGLKNDAKDLIVKLEILV